MPALERAVPQHAVGAVLPLTDLDIEMLAQAREEGRLPALVPSAGGRPRDLRQVRGPPAARAPRPALAADGAPRRGPRRDLDYPVMVKPRRGSGARSIHLAHDAAQARFFLEYVREPVMVQRAMGGPELSIDCLGDRDGRCLNAIPRTMLESRGGESIKGQVIHDEELIELGRRRDGGARGARAGDDPGLPRPRDRPRASPTSTRASAALSPRPCTRRCPGRTYPELIVAHGRRRARRALTWASSGPG